MVTLKMPSPIIISPVLKFDNPKTIKSDFLLNSIISGIFIFSCEDDTFGFYYYIISKEKI
jgi:hypothetical protein